MSILQNAIYIKNAMSSQLSVGFILTRNLYKANIEMGSLRSELTFSVFVGFFSSMSYPMSRKSSMTIKYLA